MKKYLLLALLATLLFIPISYAASCDNVTISITEPENLSYTSSINIPLEYVAVNASTCWMDIDNAMRPYNISFDCSETSSRFDVDYDGNYSYTAWAVNASSGDCNVTGEFRIDRTSDFEEAKPVIMILTIAILMAFGIVLIVFGRVFKKKYQFVVNSLSFMFVYSAFGLVLLAAREYIKVPSIYDLLVTIYWATMIIFILLISVFTVLFVVDWIKKNYDKLRKLRWGGLS